MRKKTRAEKSYCTSSGVCMFTEKVDGDALLSVLLFLKDHQLLLGREQQTAAIQDPRNSFQNSPGQILQWSYMLLLNTPIGYGL